MTESQIPVSVCFWVEVKAGGSCEIDADIRR